ncbi:hypothetical protein N824_08080 [Pedobacter sp. V48]|nr:hypothetical protein N824_08080 [Pedobacter sp. V48]
MEKRKVLMFLPLLILSFLAFGFYALGGGSGISEQAVSLPKGINTTLPDAQFKGKEPVGKMEIYNQAGTDSGKMGGMDALAGSSDYPWKKILRPGRSMKNWRQSTGRSVGRIPR